MVVPKFRPIVLDYTRVDFIFVDLIVSEIFHFKHNVGAFPLLIFAGNSRVDNINIAGNSNVDNISFALRISHRGLLTYM